MTAETIKALRIIVNNHEHAEAIKYLAEDMQKSHDRIAHHSSVRAASLRAIKKINKGKNEAIDALCEPDLRDELERWFDK